MCMCAAHVEVFLFWCPPSSFPFLSNLIIFLGGGVCKRLTGGLITFPLSAAGKDGNICILNSINPAEPCEQTKIIPLIE